MHRFMSVLRTKHWCQIVVLLTLYSVTRLPFLTRLPLFVDEGIHMGVFHLGVFHFSWSHCSNGPRCPK